jgi:hypothetical protein
MGPWLEALGLGWLLVGLPWIGATVMAVGNIDPIVNTWRGREGASPVTWCMWTVLGVIALVSQVQLGGWTAAAMLLVVITVVAAAYAGGALLRYRDAEPGVPWQRRVDIACGIGTLASLALLLAVDGKPALVLTVITDGIAAIPAVTMALWPSPQRPMSVRPFVTVGVSALCTILAAPMDVWQILYPAYLLALGVVMSVTIWVRRPLADVAAVVDDDPLRLRPDRPLRPAPELWTEFTTERRRPPWWRSPHAAELAELVPPDIADWDASPTRLVRLMEETYAAGHWKGWLDRERVNLIPPPPLSPQRAAANGAHPAVAPRR